MSSYLFKGIKPILKFKNNFQPCCYTLYENYQFRRNYSVQSNVDSVLKSQTGLFRIFSESTPVEYFQRGLTNLHDISGLPWWATIVCSTILLRTVVTLPLSIYQHYIIGKIITIKLEFAEHAKDISKEVIAAAKMYKWDEKFVNYYFKRALKKQWNELIVRENCHPAKTAILMLFQIPMWFCFSITFRNLVYMLPKSNLKATIIYDQLTLEGLAWFTDLTQSDIFLPILLAITNLAIIQLQELSQTKPPTKFQRYASNVFRGLIVIMVPVTIWLPSCLTLYWTTSSIYGLLQNLVLLSPKVRRICRIPQTELELEKPYSHVYYNLKLKMKLPAKS